MLSTDLYNDVSRYLLRLKGRELYNMGPTGALINSLHYLLINFDSNYFGFTSVQLIQEMSLNNEEEL